MGARTIAALSVLSSLFTFASASKYQEYIIASRYRTIKPASLLAVNGSVENAAALASPAAESYHSGCTTFQGVNSTITLDIGKNIAGTVQFTVDSVEGSSEFIGFTFTESSLWISPYHCDSGTAALFDSPLWFSVPSEGQYAATKEHQRGGFRYLSLWHNSTGAISISNLSVNFTAAPEMKDPSAYDGYFHSSSEKLNRVWYAGAYTNQLCSADPAYGNALGIPGDNWYYNASIANGTSALIDGGKRDRLVWPGDIFISGPSIFVSTGNLDSIKNGIESLYPLQDSAGRLPWAGVPFSRPGRFQFSFTYHLYTLIDTQYYYTYSGDLAWLKKYWPQFKRALEWSLSQIDSSKLANVTSSNDWLRSGMGGHNVEANAILYHTLELGLGLAAAVGDDSVRANYTRSMQGIKEAVNANLWDSTQGLYYDNDRNKTAAAVHPQDGNSWVIIAGIAPQERAEQISHALMSRWVKPYGAPAPEAGPTVSPFATGFEVQAHFISGYPERALELIEFMWADFMLDDPRMTNSSFIEGYSTNGSLHYAPYDNDARISYAHGWATGPTSALTFFAAGLQLTSAVGKTWHIEPKLGNLTDITAGFKTPLGDFSVAWEKRGSGILVGTVNTPKSTSGTLVLPKGKVTLRGTRGVVHGKQTSAGVKLPGGKYTVIVKQAR